LHFPKTQRRISLIVPGLEGVRPPAEVDNPALVHDYQSKGLSVNVYLKDIRFDKNGWAWKTNRRQIKQLRFTATTR
jgi:hypothetical protein